MAKRDLLKYAQDALRKRALGYPQTVEEFPWGESAFKVKRKVFLFTFHGQQQGETKLTLTFKLPASHVAACKVPFATPTGYGLGKHGWVTAKFVPGDEVPLEMLYEWLDESFRAVAPVKVIEKLDGNVTAAPARRSRTKKGQV